MAAVRSSRTIAFVVAAVLVAAGIGYWGHGAWQKRELRASVAAIVQGAGERLRDALAMQLAPAPENRAETVKKLERHAAAVDKSIGALRKLALERDRELTDAADGYLVSVREILRRQIGMNRFQDRHAESLRALQDHMRVDDRSGGWVRAAVRAKERAERDFRDFRQATAAYATLLGTFPDTQKKLEPALGREALVAPDQIARARERALEASRQSAAEMEKLRALLAPR